MATIPDNSHAGNAYTPELDRLFPALEQWSVLTVECDNGQYSASRVARAVEDCDAHLINLNVVTPMPAHGPLTLELRADRLNAESIARSLERYGYTVTSAISSDALNDASPDYDSVARRRIGELLRYLEI